MVWVFLKVCHDGSMTQKDAYKRYLSSMRDRIPVSSPHILSTSFGNWIQQTFLIADVSLGTSLLLSLANTKLKACSCSQSFLLAAGHVLSGVPDRSNVPAKISQEPLSLADNVHNFGPQGHVSGHILTMQSRGRGYA